MSKRNALLERISGYYLNSGSFNGISYGKLLLENSTDHEKRLKNLIKEGLISVNTTDFFVNPHIKAFPEEDVEKQLKSMSNSDPMQTCFYPTKKYQFTIVDKSQYSDKPFKLMLALGEPQLFHKAFDLHVLETYRNDPRYYYNNNDVVGRICIKDEFYQSNSVQKKDKTSLTEFGFAFDFDMNKRVVAAFVCDLASLTPEHQQIWKSQMVTGNWILHPGFLGRALGMMQENISVSSAILLEMQVINEMTVKIKRKGEPFFKKIPEKHPKELSFLIRPTLSEFHKFIHLMDKLLSDNINKTFFKPFPVSIVDDEGSTRGTIAIFEEWIVNCFKISDRELSNNMIKVFRDIRHRRQKPAHAIIDDVFDQKYFFEQKELMLKIYKAVRTFRLLLLHNVSECQSVEVPSSILEGKIWNF